MFIGTTILHGCAEDKPLLATESITNKLIAHTWKINRVSIAEVDQTALFQGMTLVFTASSFTSVNGGVVWPGSGTWKYTDETGKAIKRGDDVVVNLVEVSDAKLQVTLTWSKNTFAPGRISSIRGLHVFEFTK